MKLFNILRGAGLLPPGNVDSADRLHPYFEKLDEKLARECLAGLATPEEKRKTGHVVPYLLRARALDNPLTPHELGRALYHLAQRRGFESNRKAPVKEDEKPGEVKTAILDIENKMEAAGARTLGEYFSKLDPEEARIRKRWTSRRMYRDEFEHIWVAQKRHHPGILTDELKDRIYSAIFFQRKLKNQRDRIGKCELEPNSARAPWAILEAQRFRTLQQINNVSYVDTKTGEVGKFNDEQRKALLDALETKGKISFTSAKKIVGLKRHCKFNFEDGVSDGFIGNKTGANISKVIGEKRWHGMSMEEREALVEDMRSFENEGALARKIERKLGLDAEEAGKLASTGLEDGHCRLSRKALNKILPLLEEGKPYKTAEKEIYGDRDVDAVLDDLLPPVMKALPELRNPIVTRALTELRKVVNSIVKKYGKPDLIRVEMIRDLKRPKDKRQAISKRNNENKKAREKARAAIIAEAGIQKPGRDDILKYQLAEECGWVCPYTGKPISMENLYRSSQFDIEHIIPFSRCLDNTFVNKTLCYHEENRKKNNRIPSEAYDRNSIQWQQILDRVSRFKSNMAAEKLRRFKMTTKEVDEEYKNFSERQLRDTSYIARLAVKYLSRLYGGDVDPYGRRRIQHARGQVTMHLRNALGLNKLLNDGGPKTRVDHRHHAVDAIAVALTTPATTKMLSDAAKRAENEGKRLYKYVKPPWEGFLDDARKSINDIVVSHRVSRKVNGPLHEETYYGPPKTDEDGKIWHPVRKPVEKLSRGDIDHIIDDAVRMRVLERLEEMGVKEPKEAFKDVANHPFLTARDGRKIPIHKVRIKNYTAAEKISSGAKERYIHTGSNHHIAVLEVKDKKGKVKWEAEVVTTYEAMLRKSRNEPIVKRDYGEGRKFLFSLVGGDIIEIDEEGGARGLYRIRTISNERRGNNIYPSVSFVRINDARMKKDILQAKEFRKALVEPLRKLNCRKVVITPLGEVRSAND